MLASCLSIAGCDKMEDNFPFDESYRRGLITPYCTIESGTPDPYISGILGTKSLIDTTTIVDTILCNFLVIDKDHYTTEGYATNWGTAALSEASISTIPDNKLRTISLSPERPYHTEDGDYTSRMIGWYPRTCSLSEITNNENTTYEFNDFTESCIVDGTNKTVSVKFTGLDGSKDIMVSDIREGSYNNPFGKMNSFTFKHYLSAVRVHALAEESSQDLGAWGEIQEVVFINQPSSCTVKLPQTPYTEGRSTGFAADVDVVWSTETVKNKIITSPIFGEKDKNSNNVPADKYPIKLEGNNVEKYLGYNLIKPNDELWIQIHTTAGVYDVKIDNNYVVTDPETSAQTTYQVFKPGYIYDIHLHFKTNGTIDAFLLNDGNSKYYDLTQGRTYSTEDYSSFEYHWANCYVIESAPTKEYDGFCFDATVIGNGDDGLMSVGAQSLYPANAHISPKSAGLLWETSPGLISQIELLFGYVKFKVKKVSTDHLKYQEGNAVIAVYDENKKILWSWHIWITDTPQDISYNKIQGTDITILDRNLGATAAMWEGNGASSGSLLETYGLYYQWGRKDPSMGPPSADYYPINMITAPYYDYSSDTKDAAEVLRLPMPTLKDAVENPMHIILPTALTQTYYFNWLYEKIDFLWGYDETTGTNSKTIYDPCPYGYKVSGGELGDLFSSERSSFYYSNKGEGQIVTNQGSTFYFPYTGYKGVDRGLNSLIASWKYVGQKADYQSAIVNVRPDDKDYYMHRGRNYLSSVNYWTEVNIEEEYTAHQIADHTNRRTAAPVRCVKDEQHNRVSAFLTPDKYTVSSATDVVKFSLYAKSFSTNIESVTLSVGYHLAGSGGTDGHKEYVLQTWTPNATEWSNNNNTVSFTFNKIKKQPTSKKWEDWNETTDGYIPITETTGAIRFILRVQTVDNIFKMSSTTISLATNNVDFTVDDWSQNTVLVGQPVDKFFRIYGSSQPVKVDMIKVNPNNRNDTTIVDITNNLVDVSDPSAQTGYSFDYRCSTAGLSFDTKGWNRVRFKITFANGSTIITPDKWFKVGGINLSPVINVSSDGQYIIQNISNSDYINDGGGQIKFTETYSYENLFRLVTSSAQKYKIMNVLTSDYVSVNSWGYTISITNKSVDSASDVEFVYYNTDGGYFTISIQPSIASAKYWGFTNNNTSYVQPLSDANDNMRRWKIYKITEDYNDVSNTPPAGDAN